MVGRLVWVGWVGLLALFGCGGQAQSEATGSAHQELVDCTTAPEWALGSYAGGAQVRHRGAAYQCKAFPFAGWCGQAGYEPGVSPYWADAWTRLDSCSPGSGGAGGSSSGGSGAPSEVTGYCPQDGAACCPAGYTPVVLSDAADTAQSATPLDCIVGLAGSDTIAAQGGNHVVVAGAGDDTFTAANGDNFVVPGPGIDNVATGVGNDTIYIFDLCEVSAGDQVDAGTGYDTLVTPVPLARLQQLGVNIANVENVVVQAGSCRSECSQKPDCSGHGSCIEGASTGQTACRCNPGYHGDKCDVQIIDPEHPTSLTALALHLDLTDKGPDRPVTELPRPSDGGVVVTPVPPLINAFPTADFAFKVTHARLGYNDDSPGMRADVFINGTKAGTYNYGCFAACFPSGGCVVPSIGTFNDSGDQTFHVDVDPTSPVVVRIEYNDYDACGPNDAEGSTTVTFDPRTGQVISGDVDHPPNCDASSSGFGVCWEAIPGAVPPASIDASFVPQVCATWRADFVDEGAGESIRGADIIEPLGGGDDPESAALEYPASFAKASLALSAASGATVWQGFLDQDGCIPVAELRARGLDARYFSTPESADTNPLWMRLDVTTEMKRADVTWQVRSVPPGSRSFDQPPQFDANTKKTRSSFRTYSSSREQAKGDLSHFRNVSGWLVAPERLVFNDGSLDDMTRVSAVVGRLLATLDNGTVPGTYVALADDGCPSASLNTDSCVSQDTLFVGPATGNLPTQSHWKFITAHEAGHLVQSRAMGDTFAGYQFRCLQPDGTFKLQDDPCGSPAVCGCSHVDSANSLHCLQSLELPGAAQLEGFAQFYASKVWNNPGNTCGFAYYKEFLWPDGQCPPGAPCEAFGAPTVGAM